MGLRRNSALRPAGHTFVMDVDGKETRGDTLQCVHCGAHWQVVRGSGRVRGFCTRCNGPTCGKHQCDTCVPTEQRLENLETGLPEHHRPTRVAFTGLVMPD